MTSATPVSSAHSASAMRRYRVEDTGPQDWAFDSVDQLCEFCAKELLASKKKYSKLAEDAGVCSSTIRNLAVSNTRFPRAATVLQVLRALGFEVIVRG